MCFPGFVLSLIKPQVSIMHSSSLFIFFSIYVTRITIIRHYGKQCVPKPPNGGIEFYLSVIFFKGLGSIRHVYILLVSR